MPPELPRSFRTILGERPFFFPPLLLPLTRLRGCSRRRKRVPAANAASRFSRDTNRADGLPVVNHSFIRLYVPFLKIYARVKSPRASRYSRRSLAGKEVRLCASRRRYAKTTIVADDESAYRYFTRGEAGVACGALARALLKSSCTRL